MPWVDQVSTIICAFLPGQEDGNAIASILFGDTNPSGKLPVTFPPSQKEIPVNTEMQYPGINNEAYYSEKLLVGYRWYDAMNIAPLFPFGHGLSYTSFDYNNIEVSGSLQENFTISCQVKNVGAYYGGEVVQLYIGYPSSAGEPPRVLRGFQKVFLPMGDFEEITFIIDAHDVSIWDMESSDWMIINGLFNVFIGSSSQDIRLTSTFTVSSN